MDLNQIKNKLTGLQDKKKGSTYEKVDYSKVFWRPKVGKTVIRILPSKFNKENPFREVFFHYGFTKGPILALSNWGEKDPIEEFVKSLRKSPDKEDWTMAGKISPKMRIFVPIIVRGEEEKGTRLFEFGALIYKQLLSIAVDDDYGDFTDIIEGRDITIEGVEEVTMGRKGVKCTVIVKPKTTPITNDSDLLEKLLNEQPDILSINRKYTFDQLKDVLQNFLNPEESDEVVNEGEETETETELKKDLPADFYEESSDIVAEPKKSTKSAKKTTSADKFEELFQQ
jgi:hypothetical protein